MNNYPLKTSKNLVGEPINLTAQTCGDAFSNYQWTVDGYAVGGYDVGSGTLTANFATTNSIVSFYWVDSGSKQVFCSAVCGGVSCSTNVTLMVLKPTAIISPKTYFVTIDGNILRFGSSTNNGIIFYNSISIPNGFSGTNIWSQIITSDNWTETDTNGVIHGQFQNCNPPWGDLPTPYSASMAGATNFTPVDWPSVPLFNDYLSASVDDHFVMTMLFEPTGGIPVPLEAVTWYWQGAATNNAGIWTIVGTPANGNPSVSPTTTFPQWNCPWGVPSWNPPLTY